MTYDALIAGGGHNGLVTACYLAKAGLKVVVVEKNDWVGGAAVSRSPFIPGCIVRARPIAVLNLEDEHGGDEKLVCVPVDSTFPYYSDVRRRTTFRRSCSARSSTSLPTTRTLRRKNG